ncbi:MAG: hypothetical protein LBS44_02160 [Deltaproteobacteria bacterium]|nr:hypothetical protein [Deltaproteobacteria bacterium]
MDDTDQSQPKTAYIAKSSFTRHVTNVVLDNATLHIGCQGAKNFIFFDFDVPIKNDQSKKYNVEFQLDEGKINKSKWVLSSNLKALIVEKPEVFIKNLLKTSLILVKIEPENSSAETSETIESYFNISDLKDSFKFVQENCQWK